MATSHCPQPFPPTDPPQLVGGRCASNYGCPYTERGTSYRKGDTDDPYGRGGLLAVQLG